MPMPTVPPPQVPTLIATPRFMPPLLPPIPVGAPFGGLGEMPPGLHNLKGNLFTFLQSLSTTLDQQVDHLAVDPQIQEALQMMEVTMMETKMILWKGSPRSGPEPVSEDLRVPKNVLKLRPLQDLKPKKLE